VIVEKRRRKMIFGYPVVMKRGDEKCLSNPFMGQETTEESLVSTRQGGEMIKVLAIHDVKRIAEEVCSDHMVRERDGYERR
jgi:hypothetical protein